MLTPLIVNITNNNSSLINDLTNIIIENNIKSLEELKQYEDKLFTIDGKVLSDAERICYVQDIYFNEPFTERDLTFKENMAKLGLENMLEKELPIEEKFKVLIKLFNLTGKKLYFCVEAYNFIQNKVL